VAGRLLGFQGQLGGGEARGHMAPVAGAVEAEIFVDPRCRVVERWLAVLGRLGGWKMHGCMAPVAGAVEAGSLVGEWIDFHALVCELGAGLVELEFLYPAHGFGPVR